jgi:hypothetical protein
MWERPQLNMKITPPQVAGAIIFIDEKRGTCFFQARRKIVEKQKIFK